MRKTIIAAGVSLLALTACTTVGPDFQRPADPAIAGYAAQGDASAPASVQLKPSAQIAGQWWTSFGSADLDRLVDQALANNFTLAQADAALARANALASVARGGSAPQVDGFASGARERINTASFGIAGFPSPTINLYSIGTDVSFDLDVFGGNRRKIESAEARAEAEARRTDAAYLSLTGSVVTRAIEAASLRAQIEALDGIIADDQRTLDMIGRAIQAGGAPASASNAAEAQLAEDQAKLPPLRKRLANVSHALALLVGKAPSEWQAPVINLASLRLPEAVPVSLPSELVHKRPDILAAEADLHAATADIGVATAAFYPKLSLEGAFSFASLSTDSLFNYDSSGWSAGPSLTAPLFHGGSLKANKQAAVAAARAADASYRQTVLTAFVQVADLLQSAGQSEALIEAQSRATAAADENSRLASLAFENGAGSLLSVIDAQRQAQRARLGTIDAQAQLRADLAALYVATAADWRKAPGT
jgi:NodT family efflux transporter outer membrane factor (OMF) lipoprotein